jgi:hypothetical protein
MRIFWLVFLLRPRPGFFAEAERVPARISLAGDSDCLLGWKGVLFGWWWVGNDLN